MKLYTCLNIGEADYSALALTAQSSAFVQPADEGDTCFSSRCLVKHCTRYWDLFPTSKPISAHAEGESVRRQLHDMQDSLWYASALNA